MEDAIPKFKFDWVDFNDILSGAVKKECIIAVIARVVNINSDKYVPWNGTNCRKVEVELEDARVCLGDESLSMRFTQLSSGSQFGVEDEWLNLANRRTIVELKNAGEAGSWVILGTVQKLLTNYEWYYLGCSICTKKVNFECEEAKCRFCRDKRPIFAVPRYRVQLEVKDHTDSSEFVLWDREAFRWIKKSAADVKQEAEEAGELPGVPPAALDIFLGKTYLFNVKTKQNYNTKNRMSFTVQKMNDDEQLINHFKTNIEMPLNYGEMHTSSIGAIGSIKNQPLENDSMSVTSENDPDTLLRLDATPMKKLVASHHLDLIDPGDFTPPQASSSKEFKRVKIE